MTASLRALGAAMPVASLRGSAWRVRQGLAWLVSRPDATVDRRLQALLSDDRQWDLLARLPAFDRAHHLQVHDALHEAGFRDPDLLLAALLHDVGKADSRGRARLVDRSLRVLLLRTAPFALTRLTAPKHPRLAHGLFLAQHHAQLGAILAANAGASDRCCEFIARHEERGPQADRELAALIAVDNAVIR